MQTLNGGDFSSFYRFLPSTLPPVIVLLSMFLCDTAVSSSSSSRFTWQRSLTELYLPGPVREQLLNELRGHRQRRRIWRMCQMTCHLFALFSPLHWRHRVRGLELLPGSGGGQCCGMQVKQRVHSVLGKQAMWRSATVCLSLI